MCTVVISEHRLLALDPQPRPHHQSPKGPPCGFPQVELVMTASQPLSSPRWEDPRFW